MVTVPFKVAPVDVIEVAATVVTAFEGIIPVNTFPSASTPMHVAEEGHERALMPLELSTSCEDHELLDVGSVVDQIDPNPPATQSEDVAQAIDKSSPLTTFAVDHALLPPVGFVDQSTYPLAVTATQRFDAGQLMLVTSPLLN